MIWYAAPNLLAGLLAYFGLRRLKRHMFHVDPHQVEITRHEVRAPDLPSALDGLTLCQISDLHISAHRRNEAVIAQAIRMIHADLFVFTGDMIFRQSGIAAFFRWLDELGDAARPAVAILGNAEHKSFVRTEEVLCGLAQRGIPTLNNAVMRFPFRDGELQIVGVDDPHENQADFARAYAEADPNKWTLLLCHSPDGATEIAGRRADLMLCGHTHAGQIRLPFIGALTSNTKYVRGLTGGWYAGEELNRRAGCDAGNTRLYVSRGLGTGRITGRLLCRPELPVFTLRRADEPRA